MSFFFFHADMTNDCTTWLKMFSLWMYYVSCDMISLKLSVDSFWSMKKQFVLILTELFWFLKFTQTWNDINCLWCQQF